MKSVVKVLSLFIMQFAVVSYANSMPQELSLSIQFDNKPNKTIQGQMLHIDKQITINPNYIGNNLVATQSEVIKNFPVTLAMLVKPLHTTNEQTELEFNFVHYGYNHHGTLILQPKMILKNGQTAEIKTALFDLKVSANWQAV